MDILISSGFTGIFKHLQTASSSCRYKEMPLKKIES